MFDGLFSVLQDGKSTWHLYTEDGSEIWHAGPEAEHTDPGMLINESNKGELLHDENGRPFCLFSMTMASPEWTLVREVNMENYEQVVHRVRGAEHLPGRKAGGNPPDGEKRRRRFRRRRGTV